MSDYLIKEGGRVILERISKHEFRVKLIGLPGNDIDKITYVYIGDTINLALPPVVCEISED